MKIFRLNHCRLPEYIFVYDEDNKELLLSSRENDNKLLLSVRELEEINNSLNKVYRTISSNLRVLKLGRLKFYHNINLFGYVYISESDNDNYISIATCDLKEILKLC